MSPTTFDKGLKAEWLAAWLLRLKGYRILAQRYKTHLGEVDLIARRGQMLVFIEVKQRTSLRDALEAVRPQSQIRIRRAAELYLQSHPKMQNLSARFDVITYVPPFSLRHLDNVDMTGA